jgi:hypothetical protein
MQNKKVKMAKKKYDFELLNQPSHSFRNFDVGEQFKEGIEKCNIKDPSKRVECKAKVRAVYNYVEAGRLSEMGDKIHNFMSRLDYDEVKLFKNKFPDAVKIANEYALVEDLKTF